MDSALQYCYFCRAYHDAEEGRCAWSWMKWGAAGIVKSLWYVGTGIGAAMGWVVLAGWTVLFLGLAYYFIKFLFTSLGQLIA